MKEISIDESKRIQVDILKLIHEYCCNNGLKYTLAYGSMLGAVRHKGFIPWDDDIDIAMLRSDYEKLMSGFEHDYIKIYDYRKDEEYCYGFAKVIDTRTVLEENTTMANFGIGIDVFPIDDLYDDEQSCKDFIKSIIPLKRKYRYKLLKPSPKNVWWKRIAIRLAGLTVLPYSLKDLVVKINDAVKSNGKENSKYVGVLTGTAVTEKCIMPRKWFEEYCSLDFESNKFMCIKDFDEFLTFEYGDYMQLPPEGKRMSPHTLNRIYWK
ncbi:MAG: LicD family protein [Paludibacteraceae bacterium]|nr:LicD family protein [Paludibacteraceae bacterium]